MGRWGSGLTTSTIYFRCGQEQIQDVQMKQVAGMSVDVKKGGSEGVCF